MSKNSKGNGHGTMAPFSRPERDKPKPKKK